MARSKAKKQRMKHEREGKLNPELNRLSWNGLVPTERKTPTRSELQQRLESKHKPKWNRTLHESRDDSIFAS